MREPGKPSLGTALPGGGFFIPPPGQSLLLGNASPAATATEQHDIVTSGNIFSLIAIVISLLVTYNIIIRGIRVHNM